MTRWLAALAILLLACSPLIAGDSHQDDETHTVVYTVLDTNGNHVSGQTVRLSIKSSDTVRYYNFSTGAWGTFSGSSNHVTMTEDANGGFYFRTVTIDSATLASGDVVFVVSNDDSTYADLQAEAVSFSNLNNLIKIFR